MAYINQEIKKELTPAIKAVLKKYCMKGTISISNHSCLNVNISSGVLDMIAYWSEVRKKDLMLRNLPAVDFESFSFSTPPRKINNKIEKFMNELISAMKGKGWYDKSDSMVDYFDIKHYVNVNVGKWDKPYMLTS